MLANLYLDTLDDALLDADHVLIRYADDFIVLTKTQKRAEAALELTKDVLNRLTLRLNPVKTRIVHFDEGMEFCAQSGNTQTLERGGVHAYYTITPTNHICQ